jgi:hypothetical protein
MTLEIHKALVDEIDAFLEETKMGESYFGKVATGNSEVVARLRNDRTITGLTEKKLRDFMAARRKEEAA